jgi:20S proteasome subunit alpha 3
MEAINNAASALGLLCSNGIVLAVEKRVQSKLLEKPKTSEKMYKIDDHIACAVAGLTSDANILLNEARLLAQKHRYRYREPQNVEDMIKSLCNMKQSYTQFGGLRPFGVSFLIAGYDKHFGFQLYLSDPSGNYGGWNAAAIGNNNQIAKDKLKSTYDQKMSVEDGLKYSVGVLKKTMDIIPSTDRMEFATITLDKEGSVQFKVLSKDETEELLGSVKGEEEDTKSD